MSFCHESGDEEYNKSNIHYYGDDAAAIRNVKTEQKISGRVS